MLVSTFAGAQGLTSDYRKTVLDNGTTIVSRYMPDSQLVTIQIRVMSGLSNEGEYASSGVSHFLEHLLFKGTDNKSSEQIRKEIKAMGGMVNASTGLDSAEYHLTVPNSHFEEAFSLLVDMVSQPVFTSEEMENEGEVILREIRMRNDSPTTRRIRLLFSQSYREHVYKYPIIGYEEVFKQLTREDILKYHSAVYRPERMVVGIAGGVSEEEVLRVSENELSGLEKGMSWQVSIQTEPRQIDESISKFPAEVSLGYLAMGFHTTSMYSRDLYSGDILSILLGEGNDSRLYKRLVKDKELLYSVSSLNYTPKYPGLFIITGIGDAETIEEARNEIFAVVEGLKLVPVTDQELERARNQIVAEYFRMHENIGTIADSMTNSQLLTGDPAFFEKYVDEIKKVDRQEIEKIVEDYLTIDNSTTVLLIPEDIYVEEEEAPEWRKVQEEVKMMELGNGLKIIAMRKGNLPLVSVTLASMGGIRAENVDNNGISNLTSALILKGTNTRSEDEIIPVLERKGGGIGTFSGLNSIGITMDVMADNIDEALDIFEDVAKNASFPPGEIKKEKREVVASIVEENKDIFRNGTIHLQKLIYGEHPYAMRVDGRIQTVVPLTREEIMAFYKDHMVPEKTVLSIVGDIDPDRMLQALADRFLYWRGDLQTIEKKEVMTLTEAEEEDISMKKEQSLFLMGFQSVEVSDDRKYALDVISSILSGSDGLLFHAAREEQALTYTSGAISNPGVDPGYFVVYVATTEEDLAKARDTVLEVLDEIKTGNITEEDVTSAKNWLISQYALSLQSNSSVSMTMALEELYGLGYDNYKKYPEKVRAVTKGSIVSVANELLDMDKAAIVVVHSEKHE